MATQCIEGELNSISSQEKMKKWPLGLSMCIPCMAWTAERQEKPLDTVPDFSNILETLMSEQRQVVGVDEASV